MESVADTADVRRYVVAPLPYHVGRDHGASLWLPHKSISKRHAQFFLRDGELMLCDLGSTNGTFINAERLHEESAVQSGDLVHFADIGFRAGVWRQTDGEGTGGPDPMQLALALEIHERRRAEEAVWNTEAMCAPLVDTALDGVILIDMAGRIHSFNRAAERLFGYTANKAQGRNVSMLMPPPHRDDHTRYMETYLRTGVDQSDRLRTRSRRSAQGRLDVSCASDD